MKFDLMNLIRWLPHHNNYPNEQTSTDIYFQKPDEFQLIGQSLYIKSGDVKD